MPLPSLCHPSPESLREFLSDQERRGFTYIAVGATAWQLPARYVVDHTRVELGTGESTFQAARAALQRWEQFRLGWVEPWPGDTPIREEEVVAVLGRAMGFWWLNACRTVYAVDETGPVTRC